MLRLVLATLVAVGLAGARAQATDIRVVTYNQYIGDDLSTLLGSKDLSEGVVKLLQNIARSRVVERLRQQAVEIERNEPDLIALQESWQLSCVDLDPPAAGKGCRHPSIAPAFVDFLGVTLTALNRTAPRFDLVAKDKALDVRDITVTSPGQPAIRPGGLPFTIGGQRALLVAYTRDAILARRETVDDARPTVFPAAACKRALSGCNFQTALQVTLDLGGGSTLNLPFARGFVGVDAKVRGTRYRLVTTQLEVHEPQPGNALSTFYQAAQAAELLAVLKATPPDRELVVVGDLNTSPVDPILEGPLPLPPPFNNGIVPPYLQFRLAGYADLWLRRPHQVPDTGFTCCQAPDLRNRASLLVERIDFVLARHWPAYVARVARFGARSAEKTASGLWPSDHAGVAASFRY